MTAKMRSSRLPEFSDGPKAKNRPVRVFLNDNGQGAFVCPACGNGAVRDLGKYLHENAAIRIKCKCKCGHVYPAIVEQRHYFRKPSDFIGTFAYTGSNGRNQKGMLRVTDISQSGMQFAINEEPAFRVGDRLSIEFRLNDEDLTLIQEEGTVQRIQSRNVGIQFDDPERYGRLGQYLFQ